MKEEKILHLTLKKKWFDMIASGEKKEEYREIKKYWATRLTNGIKTYLTNLLPKGFGYEVAFKKFDSVVFKNGYSKNAPTIKADCLGIEIKKGNEDWGAPKEDVFVIKLGNITTL